MCQRMSSATETGRSDPSLPDALNAITGEAPESEADARENSRTVKSHLAIVLAESQFVSEARQTWSNILSGCIVYSLMFQGLLTLAVGVNALNFKSYGSFLSVVIGGTFAQVVGLAAIALRWIFSGKKPEEILEDLRSSQANKQDLR